MSSPSLCDVLPTPTTRNQMKKPPSIGTGNTVITLLCVTPIEEDYEALSRMLPNFKWMLRKARTLSSALVQLRNDNRIPLVLCERDLLPGSWKDILDHVSRMSDPPLLIVTSRLADEQLWSEALNLGAYDVLAKPFDATEVSRILSLAWLHRRDQHHTAQKEFLAASGM